MLENHGLADGLRLIASGSLGLLLGGQFLSWDDDVNLVTTVAAPESGRTDRNPLTVDTTPAAVPRR